VSDPKYGGDSSADRAPRVPRLEVAGAKRFFGDRAALDGVDLTLERGEIYGLLGPNGAGKTSLVQAICGRLRLDMGWVRVCGEDPSISATARRRLGLVPQDLALYPELSARENLEIFGRLLGLGSAEAREVTTRVLDRIGLSDRASDRVQTLSGGMKRRLNVAAGVIHHPQVLLLDEPTVGVDPAARESIHDLLLDLRNDGLAIVLTTHDLEQAAEMADRVGVLIDGRIRAEGRVEDLIREIFGDGKELIVVLSEAPDQLGRDRLVAEGLQPSHNDEVWTGRIRGGLDDLSAVTKASASAGVSVKEVRVREPGLRGVFFRLAGREIDA
jgi:ABC-2 type transport system ATP-binding protein